MVKPKKATAAKTPAAATDPKKSRSEPIKFRAIFLESKIDRFGTTTVKFEVSQVERDKITALTEHTEKVLDIEISPPDKTEVFGRVVED